MTDEQLQRVVALLLGTQMGVAHIVSQLHQKGLLDREEVSAGLRRTAQLTDPYPGFAIDSLAQVVSAARPESEAQPQDTGSQNMRDILRVIEGGLSSRPASDQEDPDAPPSPEPPDKGA